jgi:hypothetical protein
MAAQERMQENQYKKIGLKFPVHFIDNSEFGLVNNS